MPKSMISTPAARSRAAGLLEAHERVGAEPGEHGGETDAHVPKASRTWKDRSSAAISIDSSRRCACAVAPGPKLTAGKPGGGELRDRRPRLLGGDGEVPGLDQLARQRVVDGDRARSPSCR